MQGERKRTLDITKCLALGFRVERVISANNLKLDPASLLSQVQSS